jgi:hypothetical protein
MKQQIQTYKFNDSEISFDIATKKVMVNATDMAKPFGKEVARFMENDNTKKFIESCLNTRNSSFLGVENVDDLFTSKQKSGTWMHRVLALKFAAWLNPDFEVWVYQTIETLLFSHAQFVDETNRKRASIRTEIERLRAKLTQESEDFRRYEILCLEDRQYGYQMSKTNRSQIELFKENISE